MIYKYFASRHHEYGPWYFQHMNYAELSDRVDDITLSEIYSIVRDYQYNWVGDSRIRALPLDKVDEIRQIQSSRVLANMIEDGATTVSDMTDKMSRRIVDGFFNPVTKVGTPLDPGFWNEAFVPVSMTPNEVTSFYASGGIPASIIDKKSKGILINGYTFKGIDWSEDEINAVKESADSLLFDSYIKESVRDGNIYGGDLLVPHLQRDSSEDYEKTIPELATEGKLEKGCIKRFWTADRWNCVLVPNYILSAEDYLHPSQMFVPITGLTVNTERAALIRPRRLPYWGTIRQMGWGISDFESYIRSLLAYEMCMEAVPIMTQQMSLLIRKIPIDGVLAQNGPKAAEEFAKSTALQLSAASNINVRSINAIGEIQVIDRHFEGFQPLIMLLRQDIGAKARIPESVIFDSLPTGFSDNSEAVTLKQAESIQEQGKELINQFQPLTEMLVYHTFGYNSDQGRRAHKLHLSFDSPVVLTNAEKNQAGTVFGGLITALIGAGLSAQDAIKIAQSFTPDIELPEETIDALDIGQPMGEEENTGDWMQQALGTGDSKVYNEVPKVAWDIKDTKKPNFLERIFHEIKFRKTS